MVEQMAFHIRFHHYLTTIGFLIVIQFNASVNGYDAEDFEVFDLVEEVGKNFYEVLGVPKDASQSSIRKAYHRLSLQLHPDHNKEENAEENFRQLVGIYEILKDEAKRKKYDNVLEVGLPDWKQPAFYYRRVRKFGIVELAIILFFILTLGQYLVSWSIYLERKYEMEEVLLPKLKKQRDKKQKKGKGSDNGTIAARIEEISDQIPKPRCKDLFPFLIVRGLVSLIFSLPTFCSFIRQLSQNALKPKEQVASNNDDDDRSRTDEESDEEEEQIKKPRRRKVYDIPELQSESQDEVVPEDVSYEPVKRPVYRNRTWFDEDIAALTKAMNKVPVGTNGRWDIIAEMLQRSVTDVTQMAKTLKLNTGPKQVSAALQGITGEHSDVSEENEQKNEENWSQTQQKALELALQSYPRGTEERWERIAECVPEKTKEECIVRYKQLVEVVKKKRQTVER